MWTPKTIIITAVGTVTTISTIVGAFLAIDNRYAKGADILSAKTEIISEMRTEVVKNRSVMISAMQRESDELDWQISLLQSKGEPVPRYMLDKRKAIERQLEALE